MELVVVALVLVVVLVLACLVLILGVVRRLRSFATRLADVEHQRDQLNTLPVGTTLEEFEVTTTAGEKLTADWLTGVETLVAFVTYGCPSCKVQLPALRDHAATGARVLVVAVQVPGEEPALPELLAALDESTIVAEEPFGGSTQVAFQVSTYPSFYLVDSDGAPLATSGGLRDLLRLRQSAARAGSRVG